jgi:FolB domain-containing protein
MTGDHILIEGLCARCIIGVNHNERTELQDVVIDIDLYTDMAVPGRTDSITDAVNYKEVKKKVLGFVESSQFFLIEALAEAIAKLCLEDPAIEKVRVRVDKPLALRFAKTVGVEITRGR